MKKHLRKFLGLDSAMAAVSEKFTALQNEVDALKVKTSMVVPSIKLAIDEDLHHNTEFNAHELLPQRANEGDAGFDLCALTPTLEGMDLAPGQTMLVSTGFKVAIPDGHVGFVCSRSGLALKNSVFVLNAPGVVDQNYRGKLGVILFNAGNKTFHIEPSMRVAQLVVVKVENLQIEILQKLDENTNRGEGGFGSTGLKGLPKALLATGVVDPLSIQQKAESDAKKINSLAQLADKHPANPLLKNKISLLKQEAEERREIGRDYDFNDFDKGNG